MDLQEVLIEAVVEAAGGYRESSGAASGCYSVSPLGACVSALPVSAQGYPITVGAGGAVSNSGSTPLSPGSDSIFSTITSKGGGAAGNPGTGNTEGSPGGSGGGARDGGGAGGTGNTPPVSPAQGTDGGDGPSNQSGPGGGGGGATLQDLMVQITHHNQLWVMVELVQHLQ